MVRAPLSLYFIPLCSAHTSADLGFDNFLVRRRETYSSGGHTVYIFVEVFR